MMAESLVSAPIGAFVTVAVASGVLDAFVLDAFVLDARTASLMADCH